MSAREEAWRLVLAIDPATADQADRERREQAWRVILADDPAWRDP